MPSFVFTGRVLPHIAGVTVEHMPEFSITGAETIPDTAFKVELREDELTVTADAAAEPDGYEFLHFHAYDLARTLCDFLATTDGIARLPVLDEVLLPSGERKSTTLADGELAARFTVHERFDADDILRLIVTDIGIARLMADVTSMLTWPHYTPIAAGRVCESIRLLTSGGRSDADWARMRELLNVDRAYLQLLTDHSAPPRHGERRAVDPDTNRTLAARAWTLTDRFLVHRLEGSRALDPERYPLLRG